MLKVEKSWKYCPGAKTKYCSGAKTKYYPCAKTKYCAGANKNIVQVHYPVPESLASLAWGQAGRLLSAIFLGMFRFCHIIPFNLTRNTLSLEEAGIVEGVSWMNYFLVIFIALPLAFLLTVKVTWTIKISSLSLIHRWHTTGWNRTEGWKFQNENMYLKHSLDAELSKSLLLNMSVEYCCV